MRGNDFLNKMENVDPAYIEAAEISSKKKKNIWIKWGAIAACLCLALIAITTISPSMPGSINPAPSVGVEDPALPEVVVDQNKTDSDKQEIPPTDTIWNEKDIDEFDSVNTTYGTNTKNVDYINAVNLFGGAFLPESILNQYFLQKKGIVVSVDENGEPLAGCPVCFSYCDVTDKIVIEVCAKKTDAFDVAELYSENEAVKPSFIKGEVVLLFESPKSDSLWAQTIILSSAFLDSQNSDSSLGIDEDTEPDRILLSIKSSSVLSKDEFIQIVTDIIDR